MKTGTSCPRISPFYARIWSSSAALWACRSAIFGKIVKIRILTRFYKCLLNPSKVFWKNLCFYVSNLASHRQRKGPFHLTGAQLVCSWETTMSVVLKPFHVKDPQNDINLATDPHSTYLVPGTLVKVQVSAIWGLCYKWLQQKKWL